ncbi:tetratricopeptide repeat protein [Marinicella sediminis]|nr:tetratricopeptide repeat protein [Marinicella sediminis]
MTRKKNLFGELLERRIPQILGMYVAAVWLAVEIADWMSERFDVPTQFSSYVFVIMISFIPLVGLLAWGHGRPGKDQWTRKQIMFIPVNLVIAWFAVSSFIKPEVQATELMTLLDEETGQMVEYEVAKQGLNQKVTGFFWDNQTGDESLNWLSYGSAWLVSQDLLRNPLITIQTPYTSQNIMSAVRDRGFDDATGEPLSLDLDIAGDRNAKWMIRGKITKDDAQLTFEASLYDVVTGALVTTISSSYSDWLFALDDVAEQIGSVILNEVNAAEPTLLPDLSISDHVSNDLEAIRQVIQSLNAVSFENDYEQGIDYLKKALEADDQLADAYVLLIDYYRNMGDFEAAKAASEEALKLDYKLYQESIFKVKANYYAVNGEQDRAIKVLENWVKIHPDSADAWQALGWNYTVIGHRLDDALMAYEKLGELQELGSTALVSQARIYRLKGDQEKAIKALSYYQQVNPEEASPLLEMAETYLQFGEIEQAKEKFEAASLLSFNNIDAELGLAKVMAMQGAVDASLRKMDELVEQADSVQEQVEVLAEKETLLFLTGRLHDAMDVVVLMKEKSQSYLPPLQQTLMYGAKEVSYLLYLQQEELAWQKFDEMRANTKPPFDQILNLMARNFHDMLGNHEEASAALAAFIEFKKQFQMSVYDQFILSSQAVEKRHAGEFEEALRLHDLAIEESRQSILTLEVLYIVDELMLQKAKTLMAEGRYEEAIEVLDQVIQRNPLYAQCQVQKARALSLNGDDEAALEVIQQIKRLWVNADPDYKDWVELQQFERQLTAI